MLDPIAGIDLHPSVIHADGHADGQRALRDFQTLPEIVVEVQRVEYKGGAQMATDLIAGHVQMMFGSMNLAITLLVAIAIAAVIGTVVQQNQPYADYVLKFGPFWFEVFKRLVAKADVVIENNGLISEDIHICTKLAEAAKQFEAIFVRAQDIPELVADGAADAGITGWDLVRESDRPLTSRLDLEFGRCRLVVASREESGVTSVEAITGTPRVATVFPHLTRQFFEQAGKPIVVVPVSGAVEVTPHLGIADLIVDLSSTGSTLKVNGLKGQVSVKPPVDKLSPVDSVVVHPGTIRLEPMTAATGTPYQRLVTFLDRLDQIPQKVEVVGMSVAAEPGGRFSAQLDLQLAGMGRCLVEAFAVQQDLAADPLGLHHLHHRRRARHHRAVALHRRQFGDQLAIPCRQIGPHNFLENRRRGVQRQMQSGPQHDRPGAIVRG